MFKLLKKEKKLYNVKVYSGRGSYSIFIKIDKKHVRWIRKDVRQRNRNLRRRGYPQEYYMEIVDSIQ